MENFLTAIWVIWSVRIVVDTLTRWILFVCSQEKCDCWLRRYPASLQIKCQRSELSSSKIDVRKWQRKLLIRAKSTVKIIECGSRVLGKCSQFLLKSICFACEIPIFMLLSNVTFCSVPQVVDLTRATYSGLIQQRLPERLSFWFLKPNSVSYMNACHEKIRIS